MTYYDTSSTSVNIASIMPINKKNKFDENGIDILPTIEKIITRLPSFFTFFMGN